MGLVLILILRGEVELLALIESLLSLHRFPILVVISVSFIVAVDKLSIKQVFGLLKFVFINFDEDMYGHNFLGLEIQISSQYAFLYLYRYVFDHLLWVYDSLQSKQNDWPQVSLLSMLVVQYFGWLWESESGRVEL